MVVDEYPGFCCAGSGTEREAVADAIDIHVSTVSPAAGTCLLEAVPDAVVKKCPEL